MNPNAQNKILQIVALKVLLGVASDIAESGYFSNMADASTDVDKEMAVYVENIGLMPVTQTNADTIVVYIKDVLLRINLRIQDARGQ